MGKTINFGELLKELDGTGVKDENKVDMPIGKVLGNALAKNMSETEDVVKLWKLAQKVYECKTIEVSASDLQFMSNCLKKLHLMPIVKGQLLEILDPDVK